MNKLEMLGNVEGTIEMLRNSEKIRERTKRLRKKVIKEVIRKLKSENTKQMNEGIETLEIFSKAL